MKIKTQLVSGYSLVIFMIFVLTGISYVTLNSLNRTAGWVSHTYDVIEHAYLLEKLLVDQETGVRGFAITGNEDFLEPYHGGKSKYLETMDALKKLVSDNSPQEKRLEEINALAIKWEETAAKPEIAMRKAVNQGTAKSEDVADMVGKKLGKRAMDGIRDRIEEFVGVEKKLLGIRLKDSETMTRKSIWILIGGAFLCLIIAMVAAVGITRGIVKQVGGEPAEIARISENVSSGDLSLKIKDGGKVATGILGSIIKMVESLQRQVGEILEAAQVIATSTTENASMITQVAAGTSEAATAVNETTATVEELKQTVQMNRDKSKIVAEDAKQTADLAKNGAASMGLATDEMARIKTQMGAIAQSVMNLSEQTQAIDEIIDTVDDLSEQSNLLAVNAAVEAAKAGEHGKGFAVVAQEIKSLAGQSKTATKRVRTILKDIQKANSASVMATEEGEKAVTAGAKNVEKVRGAIQAMADRAESSADAATQIAASSHQQTVGVDQVTTAMESIREAANQTRESMQQLQKETDNLKDLGVRLKGLMERYKL